MPANTAKNTVKRKSNQRFKDFIEIKGARSNNLKNIDLKIPKNKLVVFTGVSGSGKSSLTMDTLYAEGQRRYVESLSSYARQFLMRMKKPEVDYIKGICPAIAIEQKVSTRNARSTVGSLTEIYDFLRLLFARIGKTYSPVSGKLVKKHHVTDVVDYIHSFKENEKIQLFIPLSQKYADRTLENEFNLLIQKGFTRVLYKKKLVRIEDLLEDKKVKTNKSVADFAKAKIQILIDRFTVKNEDEENKKRIADSIQTAFYESEGDCIVDVIDNGAKTFNNRFELDGLTFLEPSPQLFNYNNSFGACPKCEGYGKIMGIDSKKVVPNDNKSVYDGAIACWKGEKYGTWLTQFLKVAHEFDFPVHKPFKELSKKEKKILWTGNEHFWGIDSFFSELREKIYKIQNRVMLARYRGRTTCHECDGGKLRVEATYITVGKKNITDLVDIPIDELLSFFDKLKLNEFDSKIAKRLLVEITGRLNFMLDLGLNYLNLSRISSTLSGGETQRINLTRTLGSNLTNSLYILDEPSVGLHPRDTDRLVNVLKDLRDLGNTVIVVEHEEDIIKNADHLIDIGPAAGIHGGEVVFNGPYKSIYKDAKESLTTKYMNGKMKIPVPAGRRKFNNSIQINKATHNNLKEVDAIFPLNTLSLVTGVSGSGKTSLVKHILYPALKKHMNEPYTVPPGAHESLTGDLNRITQVEMINQSAIGKSSRSNPITYVKAYDHIRNLMANQQLSKIRSYKPKHFSFNVDGGRCETCKGEGEQLIEMQFLADIRLECEECKGKRFKKDVLEVQYKGKNIFDILNLSIEESMEFFASEKEITGKIKALNDVGLGYVKLGQSSSTLSGGEAQRVKLASFLSKGKVSERIFFIFDEPTTGLHFHDIKKLLDALNALVEKGHTVLVVEHNMEVIKCADWIIDLGPEGGKNGGKLLFQGRPEDLVNINGSFTAQYLKEKI